MLKKINVISVSISQKNCPVFVTSETNLQLQRGTNRKKTFTQRCVLRINHKCFTLKKQCVPKIFQSLYVARAPVKTRQHNQLTTLTQEKILSVNCEGLKYCAEQNYKIRITLSICVFLYSLASFKGQSSEFESWITAV